MTHHMILVLTERKCHLHWQEKGLGQHCTITYDEGLSCIEALFPKTIKHLDILFSLRDNIFDYRPHSALSWQAKRKLHAYVDHYTTCDLEGYYKQKEGTLFFCHTLPSGMLKFLQALQAQRNCRYHLLPLLLAEKIALEKKRNAAWQCYHVTLGKSFQWDIVYHQNALFCCRYAVNLDPSLSTVTYLQKSKNATAIAEETIHYPAENHATDYTFFKQLLSIRSHYRLFLPRSIRTPFWQTRACAVALISLFIGLTLSNIGWLYAQALPSPPLVEGPQPVIPTSPLLAMMRGQIPLQKAFLEPLALNEIETLTAQFGEAPVLTLTCHSEARKKRMAKRYQTRPSILLSRTPTDAKHTLTVVPQKDLS